MMFNEVPFLDRFSAAADAGFQGVEYLFPYEFPAEAIEERLRNHHLENVLFNLAPGNWSAGERGITCIPGRESEFRQSVETAISLRHPAEDQPRARHGGNRSRGGGSGCR